MPLTPPPSAPPAAPDAPGAAPSRANPSSFRALADAFVVWQVGFRSSLADLRTWLAGYVTWAETHVTELDSLQSDVTAKASTATTQAGIATTKASEASASAEAAADAEAATLGYLQAYRATSYGAAAADPLVDPNGNPCTEGDEYFNTTDKILKRFNGTTWYIPDLDAADLALSSGSSLVGYDGGAVQDVLDAAKPMQSYTALRAYTGRASSIRITTPGVAGFFWRDDADTTTADNGGTAIVDASGRRWKRLFSGVVLAAWFGASTSAADNTTAINAAIDAASALGAGRVGLSEGEFLASQIVFKRFVEVEALGAGATELKQIGGTNSDFITSENFAALTGTNSSVASSALVPSFFGLRDIRVNGNKYHATNNPSGNTAGRGIAWYGAALMLRGTVLVYDCAGKGIYTEYTSATGSDSWQGQEEGQFDNVITRDNGGDGWEFVGPHNSRFTSVIAAYNGEYGFRSVTTATADGGIDHMGLLHTYGNGRASTPAADTGCYFGAICRISTLITDGDNATFAASFASVGQYRPYNLGGQRDGLVVSGNNCTINMASGTVWGSSTGRKAIHVTGSRNKVTNITLTTGNTDNDALIVDGDENQFPNLHIEGFSGAGRYGIQNNGSSNRFSGEVTNCNTGFYQLAGESNNTADLYIFTTAGQLAVAGATPGTSDRFNIRAAGTGQSGKTSASAQSAQVPLDITTAQTVTIAHGLLYTPQRHQVALSLLESTPSATAFEMSYMRVNSCDATNVTIGFRVAVAAAAGTLARFGVRCAIE